MKISYNINSEERNLFMDIAHIKKQIEEQFGIPYEEFCQLDPEIITRLIESKIGKKLKPDYRPIIDGIPIDKNHIIEREEIDGKIREITLSGPQKVMCKIFKRR